MSDRYPDEIKVLDIVCTRTGARSPEWRGDDGNGPDADRKAAIQFLDAPNGRGGWWASYEGKVGGWHIEGPSTMRSPEHAARLLDEIVAVCAARVSR